MMQAENYAYIFTFKC